MQELIWMYNKMRLIPRILNSSVWNIFWNTRRDVFLTPGDLKQGGHRLGSSETAKEWGVFGDKSPSYKPRCPNENCRCSEKARSFNHIRTLKKRKRCLWWSHFLMCMCVLSHVWLFATPWTVAQVPLSMGFFRQLYWSELPLPPIGDLSDSGIKPKSLVSPALVGGYFATVPPGKPQFFDGWPSN